MNLKSFSKRWGTLLPTILAASLIGCNPGSRSERRDFTPMNVIISIDEGATATKDTLLRVGITGNYISRMAISRDPLLEGAVWGDYDSLVLIPVPSEEGFETIYGRFSADGGGTTNVLSDRIEIDLSASIDYFDISAPSDTLASGDQVAFRIATGESGTAAVTFGDYFEDLRLTEVTQGEFRRTIEIPGGIIDDSVFSTATFIDAVGNTAEPVRSEGRLVIRGRELRPRLTASTRISGLGSVSALVMGGVCFVSDQHSKLHLVDVTDHTAPSYIRSIETSGWCGGMASNGRLLYLADGDAGVAIVGIFPPISAAIIGRAYVTGRATDVEIDGDYVYVATFLSGLWILNANDWTRPEVLSRLQIGGYGEVIMRHGKTLFIGGQPSVACIDVTDPLHPILLAEIAVEGDIMDGIYYEGKIYLATDTEGIVIYDVRDPANPEFVASHYSLRGAASIKLIAPYLAVGRGSAVEILNGAVPDRLPVMGDINGLRGVASIDEFNNHLYIVGEGWFYTASLYD